MTLKNNGGLVVPLKSVLRIVKQCGIILRSCVNVKKVAPGQWQKMCVSRMLNEMPPDLFPGLLEHSIETSNGIETHCYTLMNLIRQHQSVSVAQCVARRRVPVLCTASRVRVPSVS